MDVTLTGTPENEINEPESLVDQTSGDQEGELQTHLKFVFWADDGDNVFESDETDNIIKEGDAETVFALDEEVWPLADSGVNVWNPNQTPGPLPALMTKYVAKAWCFGEMGKTPVIQDGVGATGTEGAGDSTNGPLQRGTGFTCDGSEVTNIAQTDGITVDVEFTAVQKRHNEGYTCNETLRTTLTLVKVIDGEGDASQWTLSADGPTDISGTTGTVAVTNAPVSPGSYDLSETGPSGYNASPWVCVGGDSQPDGDTVVIGEGDNVTCTITNTPVLACDAALDLMLVLDRSGSISSSELTTLKGAAHAFVGVLGPSASGAHVGQTSFSDTGTLNLHLTDDEAAAHLAISALTSGGFTNLVGGITLATAELDDSHEHERAAVPDVMIVITDGNPNRPPNEANARALAAAAADAARAAGIEVYVIGVGSDVDATYLETEIADDAAHYFAAAEFADLEEVLKTIVACDSVQKKYSFVGVTTTNDGVSGNPIAFAHDSDQWPWASVNDVNGSTTPSNAQYVSLSSDNNVRWISNDPGSGDVIVKNFRFFLTEPVGDIDDIKVLWNGQPSGNNANATVWVLKTGTSPYVASNWVQLGSALGMTEDVDGYIVRHILAGDVGAYVDAGTGRIDIAVTIDDISGELETDYIELLVKSNP
jgi:uncharacterized protein YegL